MGRGHDGMGKRAALLPRHCGGVDVAVEETAGDVGHVRRERAVGLDHRLAGFVPAHLPLVGGEGRVAVVLVQVVDAEKLALEAVPAGGDVVARGHRSDEGLDGVVGVPRLVVEGLGVDEPVDAARGRGADLGVVEVL